MTLTLYGQTDVVFASRRVTAGRLAFISAAGMTARGCERSGEVAAREFSSSPFVRDSRFGSKVLATGKGGGVECRFWSKRRLAVAPDSRKEIQMAQILC